jgi:predicted nucleic acid-binding protein
VSLLVVDANIAFSVSASPAGAQVLDTFDPVAPPLLWPETRSALHVAAARGLITRETADRALEVLESGIVTERRHLRLGREAWAIADELGWTKTYGAEYLALARMLDAPLATLDRRLARAATRVGVALDADRFS